MAWFCDIVVDDISPIELPSYLVPNKKRSFGYFQLPKASIFSLGRPKAGGRPHVRTKSEASGIFGCQKPAPFRAAYRPSGESGVSDVSRGLVKLS